MIDVIDVMVSDYGQVCAGVNVMSRVVVPPGVTVAVPVILPQEAGGVTVIVTAIVPPTEYIRPSDPSRPRLSIMDNGQSAMVRHGVAEVDVAGVDGPEADVADAMSGGSGAGGVVPISWCSRA